MQKYVTDGAWLICTEGSMMRKLKVDSQQSLFLHGKQHAEFARSDEIPPLVAVLKSEANRCTCQIADTSRKIFRRFRLYYCPAYLLFKSN